jgi:hypothetical protein
MNVVCGPLEQQDEAVAATDLYVEQLTKHVATTPELALYICNLTGGALLYVPSSIQVPKDIFGWIKRVHREAKAHAGQRDISPTLER